MKRKIKQELKEIADTICVSESDVQIIPQPAYPGIYCIIAGGSVSHYLKKSNEVAFPFYPFKDLIEAEQCVEIYDSLTKNRFYHPDSKFSIKQNEKGELFLRAIMPYLHVERTEDNEFKEKSNKKIELHKQIVASFGKIPALDIDPANWGYSPDRELFYHDLHIFVREK